MNDTAADAASPASFQPLKAQTITGRRSFGRSDQITSLIAFTVPDTPRRQCWRSPLSDRTVTIGHVATIAEQRTAIAELRAGEEVQGVFACTRKDRLTAKSGAPYLAVELRDRSGAIQARAFRDADFLAGQFERGDLVWVAGRVERFREELPVAYRDLDELDGFLEHLAREVYDTDLRALLDSFLSDTSFRADFRRAPCTRSGHHAYLGGLLEHTVAVATLALEACSLHPRLNSDLLLCAAILHDAGKTREFELGAEIALSEAGALVGHLVLGQQLVSERAHRLESFPDEKLHAVAHCLLAHHGPDALPGKRFRSAEALALYRLNAVDAAVKGALEQGLS
jgi:3'-5' exoribonuclease